MNNQPHNGPPNFDRDRDMEEQLRQRALQHKQEEMTTQRERDLERQERDRQHREQQYQPAPPHQSNAGSIPLHQPVANRTTTAMHSPGGILATHGTPLGAPSGPGNAFGGPLHNDAARNLQHHAQNAAQQPQQQHIFSSEPIFSRGSGAPQSNAPLVVPGVADVGFGRQQIVSRETTQQEVAAARLMPFGGGPVTPGHQMPGPAGLTQGGQQPILNDALSYLDQVKVQFADQPDVYNRFLDIMKDFKSQAIDTPGVINRVSELFAGHPNLIQGFNTFLPPGYRIECGADNNPNTIRVTTPMGTTVQSIPGAGRALGETVVSHGGGANGFYNPQRPSTTWQQPQHSIESPEAVFSPPHQSAAIPYGHNQTQIGSYEAQAAAAAAAAAHQQQQRGVSQLTNAVSATLGQPPRNTQTPTPGGSSGNLNGSGAQPGMEKRGPVEFNHAISYVNKIKNRFQDKPEIYKQFLEILQTYQRESKPIQDVYGQVTTLFGTAPDLLEDFKQFLPESAAHAKAVAKAAEEATAMPDASQSAQLGNRGPSGDTKLPIMGNFPIPTPTTGKTEKKRKPLNQGSGSQMNNGGEGSVRGAGPQPNKRPKTHHNNKPLAADATAVSPTLTPIVPEPLPPASMSAASSEELAFFDRVKKYIGNKSTMNEFLKLCNLFSQDLIDRNVLVFKVSNFIGGSADLMNWFKSFVGYEGVDEVIDNRPKAPTGRVALSNCRGLGPSYRLLPKRERLKPCSGRDEMCHAVLNDDWASHPTWASEDSGFVAHRKNIFEEGLHRIEEERHDYDFNIECNAKVIQLLEPIAQQIVAMDPAERQNFRMPNTAGPNQAIYKRVLKKIYGTEKGPQVVSDLIQDPCAVLPVILARLKQKDEEWTFTRREWNPVWGAQGSVMYLKSLDHMGIHVKQADKKHFAAKHLVDSIKTKHEEQRRLRSSRGPTPKYQYSYQFADQEVIGQLLHVMIVYACNANQHSSSERRRISDFFEKFISTFFDLPDEFVARHTADIDRGTPDDEYEDIAPAELSNGRGRRPVNGKKADLRRGVLDRGRNGTRGRGQKEDSATGSKESTPDVDSNIDEEVADVTDDRAITEVTNERWAAVPGAVAVQGTKPLESDDLEMKADQPFQRDWYNLYCNQTVFVFFSIFQTLYQRFKDIKDAESSARAEIERAKSGKPAKQIGLLSDRNDDFTSIEDGETCYSKVLSHVEKFIKGEIEETKYQDYLRHYYLQTGWKIYTITDLLKSLCRLGSICSSPDSKEKTPDLIDQFLRNRESKETSYNIEINLRKQADKYIKDSELFLIRWYPKKNEATSQWVHRDETTFDLDIMQRKERWQYYTSSYVRIEPTEGVPRRLLRKSLLTRNLPSGDTDSEDGSNQRKPLIWGEDLTLRICVNSYKIIYKEPGVEYFIYADKALGGGEDGETRQRLKKVEESRNQRFHEKFGMNNQWMKEKSHEEVSRINQEFRKWVNEGVLPSAQAAGASTSVASGGALAAPPSATATAAVDNEVDMAG